MTTADIRQFEAGALAFGQKTYGDDLADAMYLSALQLGARTSSPASAAIAGEDARAPRVGCKIT